MATKRIFISYDYDNDRHYKNLLLAWSSNSMFDFHFNDHSTDISVNSESSAVIKRAISADISAATGFLCIVGEQTAKSAWVEWEIGKAVEFKKRIIAVKTAKDCTTPYNLIGVGASWALSFTFASISKAIDEAYE